MRSLQLTEFGAPLEWRDLPDPEPRGREVLLETVATGLCHSDLHLWEGFYDVGGGRRAYVKDRGVALPVTLGHEIVGRVIARGPEAEGVADGDVRLVYPWIGCGACPDCAEDRDHLCGAPRSLGIFSPGGFSDRVLVPDSRFLVEIGDLAPEAAASYACAGLTAYSALRKLLPLGGDAHLVILGAGGLGLMAAQLVGALTPARVAIVDIDDRKLEAARQIGDFLTLNAKETDARREIRGLTQGRGVEAVVDFVGSSETATLGVAVLAKSGTLISVGLFGGELTIPTPSLPLRNLTIRGSYTGSLGELRELIALVRRERPRPVPVACSPLDDLPRLLEQIRAGGIVGRAVVQPRAGGR